MTTRKATKLSPTRHVSKKVARKSTTTSRGDRIDFRVNPKTKDLLVRAATLCGSNLTAFVLESAQERAIELIERYEQLRLTNRDRDLLLAALDQPPEPTEALRQAFRKYA
ncbi:MAG: type II toxin-antitoxin system TacA family antitoxin [Acidiferrobacterales bacterium]